MVICKIWTVHSRAACSDGSRGWTVRPRTRRNNTLQSSCAFQGSFFPSFSCCLCHCSIFAIFVLCPFSTTPHSTSVEQRGAHSAQPSPSTRFLLPLAFPATSCPPLRLASSERHTADVSEERNGMIHKVDTN